MKKGSFVALAGAMVGALLAPACSKGSDTEFIFVPSDDAAASAGEAGAGSAATSTDAGAGDDGGFGLVAEDAGADAYTRMDAGCATARTHVRRDPVYMLLVLDGSGSMGDENKWTAAVGALDAIFDELYAKPDPSFGVGLHVFSDSKDPTDGQGPYPTSNDVFVGFVDRAQHDALRARIDDAQPSGGTPTHKALLGGYKRLENLVVLPPLPTNGKKVLVLLTDGVPNGDGTSQKAEQQACLDLASAELGKASPQGPVQTFAVGIGPFPSNDTGDYDPVFMGHLASAGGTAPFGCNPSENTSTSDVCHMQIDPAKSPSSQLLKQQFIDAIERIRSQVTSCDLTLEHPDGGGAIDPSRVNVVFTDGNGHEHVVPEDPHDGWRYDDPSAPKTVILSGQACDAVMHDPLGDVSIVLGCQTITK